MFLTNILIIFMWFFNKILFILSSIILTGGGAVWVSLSAGWTGQSVGSFGFLDVSQARGLKALKPLQICP